jgi:hypothetical protein
MMGSLSRKEVLSLLELPSLTVFDVETYPQNVCCGDIATMFVVETWPQCLLWRHNHNVCCGDIATMFVVET